MKHGEFLYYIEAPERSPMDGRADTAQGILHSTCSSFPTACLITVSQHKVTFTMWLSLLTFIQTEWVDEWIGEFKR